ncbi:TPA: hypothetical protein ACXNG6_000214 [Stenotrophomonas maltophilia]
MTTDNKTLAVDVLSILLDAECVLRRDHYKAIPDDVKLARAAVAELIERIEAALRGECQYFVLGTDGIQIREVRITKANLDSLKAALARVKGESA